MKIIKEKNRRKEGRNDEGIRKMKMNGIRRKIKEFDEKLQEQKKKKTIMNEWKAKERKK